MDGDLDPRETGHGAGSRMITAFQSWYPVGSLIFRSSNPRRVPTGQVWIVLGFVGDIHFTLGQQLGRDLFSKPMYSLLFRAGDIVKTLL